MHGLDSSAGYLQSKLADRVKTRYTPQLKFVLDEGVKASFEVTKILSEVLPHSAETLADAEAAAEATDEEEHENDSNDESDE